jgi:hypothetical protein
MPPPRIFWFEEADFRVAVAAWLNQPSKKRQEEDPVGEPCAYFRWRGQPKTVFLGYRDEFTVGCPNEIHHSIASALIPSGTWTGPPATAAGSSILRNKSTKCARLNRCYFECQRGGSWRLSASGGRVAQPLPVFQGLLERILQAELQLAHRDTKSQLVNHTETLVGGGRRRARKCCSRQNVGIR